jgi:hypothetical protein
MSHGRACSWLKNEVNLPIYVRVKFHEEELFYVFYEHATL